MGVGLNNEANGRVSQGGEQGKGRWAKGYLVISKVLLVILVLLAFCYFYLGTLPQM